MFMFSGLLVAPSFAQDELATALVEKGKPDWEPKGKALEPFGRGDTKRGTEAWGDAIPLLVEALKAQPGCGKCLQSLGRSFVGAERYDDAQKVGEHLGKLYPDRKEGPYLVAVALTNGRRAADAVPAWDRFLAIDTASITGWNERNLALLRLGQADEAGKRLDAAPSGLDAKDVGCFRTEVNLAKGDLAAAAETFKPCSESANTDLKRQVEGWMLLQEGKPVEAQNKLAQGGAQADTRLSLALVRLAESKFDQAFNLAAKLVEDEPWALDAQLVHARALAGLQKTDEALKVLDATLTATGWEQAHPKYGRTDVILFLTAPDQAKRVCVEALALKASLLEAKGDAAGATALRAAGLAVHGDQAALRPATPEAPAPAAAAK